MLLVLAGAWIALLSSIPAYLLVTALVIGPHGHFGPSTALVACVLTALAFAVGVGLGAWLGRLQRWPALLIAGVFGTAVLLSWHLLLFAVLQPDDPQADNAAGAGVVLLAVPTFLTLALPLGLGAGPGYLLTRLRRSTAP
jgi:hypothetical protein